MDALENLNKEILLETLKKNGKEYLTIAEQTEIKKALLVYSASKNENIPEETILIWVQDFKKMGLTLHEALTVIDKAKYVKKYGDTSFDTFVEVLNEEGLIFTKDEMISNAQERALNIYNNELKGVIDKIKRDKIANEEVKQDKIDIDKFLNDIQERQRQIAKEVNKVLDLIDSRCRENMGSWEYSNVAKIIKGERKSA